jgi:hypothetical protein
MRRTWFVFVFVTVTDALATNAPLGSVTAPVICALLCAEAVWGDETIVSAITQKQTTKRVFRLMAVLLSTALR